MIHIGRYTDKFSSKDGRTCLCGTKSFDWLSIDSPKTWNSGIYEPGYSPGIKVVVCGACLAVAAKAGGGAGALRSACLKLADTLEEKSKAYGDSYRTGGDFLRILFPDGIKPEAYDDLLTMVRVFDKYKRIANNPGKADPGGEDPFLDAAGYDILAYIRRGETK